MATTSAPEPRWYHGTKTHDVLGVQTGFYTRASTVRANNFGHFLQVLEGATKEVEKFL